MSAATGPIGPVHRSPAPVGALAVAAWLLTAATAGPAAASGDLYWSQRARGMSEARADPQPVRTAIAAYQAALASDPDDLETFWKLLRALHFQGEFASQERDTRLQIFDRARALSEKGLEHLAGRAGAPLHEVEPGRLREVVAASGLDATEVARLYYWAAANWGSWSKDAGLVDAVRTGVANRLRSYLDVVISLEPEYEAGGAHRFLGTLHARLPRVPLLSGWVDRDRALPQLETALAIAPREPSNRLLLGLALLDLDPERRTQGLSVLAEVANLEPRPERRVEDAVVVREARRRLERESGA